MAVDAPGPQCEGIAAMLSTHEISKAFPGVVALNRVSVDFRPGEVHALLGENGAGKSTLIKILSGAQSADSGTIEVDGTLFHHLLPRTAFDIGVATIYQEFNLIPELSVAENIFFGREMRKGLFVDKRSMQTQARRLCDQIGVSIDPGLPVKQIGVAQQQIVEIVKAVSRASRYLIMDEPTAPLTNSEIDLLFRLIRRLKHRGVSIVLITHRLEEVFEISDRVSVLRDGNYVLGSPIAEVTPDRLIASMVGRELSVQYPEPVGLTAEILLRVTGLRGRFVSDVSFELHRGEILGVAGLVGSGRTSMARLLFGADPLYGGTVELNGKRLDLHSPAAAVANGIGLLPEDRKEQGLILGFPTARNITFSSLRSFSRAGFVDVKRERSHCLRSIEKTRMKAPSIDTATRTLSGGNQQKVVLAKWLTTQCEVLIFDEPTRGIDVGAKAEIYRLLRTLTASGTSVIMISSEMPELIGMADRIVVMRSGRISGSLERSEFDQQRILALASTSFDSNMENHHA